MDHYLGVAKEEGLSHDEISTVQAIVMAVAAGKVNTQVGVVRSKAENQSQQAGISFSKGKHPFWGQGGKKLGTKEASHEKGARFIISSGLNGSNAGVPQRPSSRAIPTRLTFHWLAPF
jgi:hypothetical protein